MCYLCPYSVQTLHSATERRVHADSESEGEETEVESDDELLYQQAYEQERKQLVAE